MIQIPKWLARLLKLIGLGKTVSPVLVCERCGRDVLTLPGMGALDSLTQDDVTAMCEAHDKFFHEEEE